MDLRNERGGISPAEGCMFLAMLLFSALLIGLLITAFFRFQEPPQNSEIPVSLSPKPRQEEVAAPPAGPSIYAHSHEAHD